MEKDAFIFIGRSGCGKGTQKDLLIKHLTAIGMPYLSMYVGDFLRDFVNAGSDVAKKYKIGMEQGLLAPSFIAVSAWGNTLMKDYKEGQSLVFDGTPRTLPEAYVLETAFDFLGFIHPVIIYLNVSNKWSKERLMARGRQDDNEIEIEKRLSWFDTTVLPGINYFRSKPNYLFVEINGEQTIDQVAADIMKALPYLSNAQNNTNPTNRSYSYISSEGLDNLHSNNENR
ncbi:MAG: nucleoside monophosphate kinase [Minisyncoccia bacterium]